MHFCCSVLLPSCGECDRIIGPADVEADVERVMEPSYEGEEFHGRNPRWDSWHIGGRFTGIYSDYDPNTDPTNIETCTVCNGTGMRNDELGKEARLGNPDYTCNGCKGEGKKMKWPSLWTKNSKDVLPVQEVLDREDFCASYAILEPNGVWFDREEAQNIYYPPADDERKKRLDVEWDQQIRNLLEKYKDHLLVVVDCHI